MTPAYCSPEQAAHQPVGQKTDVWSWGLSVLEMFSGEVTWISGQVAPEVFEAYLETGPEDASIPKMPEALVALLRRCFQRNAEGRPTAGDIVRELSRLKREPISGPSTAKAGSKSKPSPKELKELVDKLLRRAREKREKPIAIEGYTIEKELGRAGMAAVYLARQEQSGKQVALRVLHPRAGPDKRAEAMWQRELEMLKDLKHPNIVEILDFGRAGDVLFLVMEFCNGGSVAQLMERRGGSLRLEEASTIMFHTLDGLIYLHDNGIVHRDLKPSNILLNGPDGLWVAKIQVSELAGRFARHVGLATSDDLDLDGGVAGTLAFMSRPQVINFRYAKPEVDVWAAAACLYNMLTGKYPRDFPRGQDPLRTILSTDAVPILKRNPSIPTGLAEVIDRALIDKPEISFKTAAELKQALERAL